MSTSLNGNKPKTTDGMTVPAIGNILVQCSRIPSQAKHDKHERKSQRQRLAQIPKITATVTVHAGTRMCHWHWHWHWQSVGMSGTSGTSEVGTAIPLTHPRFADADSDQVGRLASCDSMSLMECTHTPPAGGLRPRNPIHTIRVSCREPRKTLATRRLRLYARSPNSECTPHWQHAMHGVQASLDNINSKFSESESHSRPPTRRRGSPQRGGDSD